MRFPRPLRALCAGLFLAISTATVWAQEAAPAAVPAADEGVSLIQVIVWGGPIGYIIILLSVVSLMLVAHQVVVLRKKNLCPDPVRDQIAGLIREKKLKDAVDFVRTDNSLLSRIVSVGLSRIRGGYPEMEQVMNDAAEDEAMRLEQAVGHFALLANIAPLLGLLGTVTGMVLAFNKIANDPAGAASPAKLALPIEMALVTTVFGLIVAIPCVIAFSFFRNKLHRLLAETGLAVDELMMPFRGLQATPVRAAATAAARAAKPEPSTVEDATPTGQTPAGESTEAKSE